MARPLRSRRAPLKLSDGESIVGIKSRNTNNKITASGDNKDTLNNAAKIVTSKTKSEKGILLAGKKTITQISQSPILRDRTNLPAETFKIDYLMKKGADDKTTNKTTKAIRVTSKRPANEEVESEASTRPKQLRAAKTKDPESAVEIMENLPVHREKGRKNVTEKEKTSETVAEKANLLRADAKIKNARKTVVEKNKTEKVLVDKENTQKAVTEKENNQKVVEEKAGNEIASPVKENIKNLSPEKENMQDMPTAKVKGKNVPAKGKATSKKLKVSKEISASKNDDDSLIIESENAADSQNTPKPRSVKAVPRKIVKKVAFSKLSLSQQSNKSTENRKKKSQRRSSELRKKGKDEATTSGSVTGKKFFKNKAVDAEKILSGKKITTNKRRKVERPRISTSFRLRQTTLSESFAKHATKKNLRPRVALKNYHESTIATDKDETKRPVYKTAKFSDKSDDDGSEIYEFHFDSNDSCEKIAKKKKKTFRKNVITKKRSKTSGTKKTISKTNVATKNAVNKNEVKNLQPVLPTASDKAMDTNEVPAIVVNDFDISPVSGKSENVKTQSKKLEPQAERVETLKNKPKIVECLNLTEEQKINLTSTPQITKSSEINNKPLRKTNAFNLPRPSIQYKTMLNHALFNKSLSPIKKALEDFDPGSPWRPPIITGAQFSRVKNVVQSTPQVRKFSTMLENNRNSLESKKEDALVRIDKISEKDEKNANAQHKNSEDLKKINKIAKNDEKSAKIEKTNSKALGKMDKIAESEEKSVNIQQKNIKISEKINEIAENDKKSAKTEQTNSKASVKMNKITENDKKSANIEQMNIKASEKMNKKVENDGKSANVEQKTIKSMPQKIVGLAQSPRKFGTVISNVNVAITIANSIGIHENNAKLEINRGSPRKNVAVASPQPVELSDSRISDCNDFDDNADKENSIPAFTSPKKSQKSPKKLVTKQSPLRPFNQAKIAMKENWEPQPGPSGLQKRNSLNESRILRQSNLNNFLNIDEVPTSTRISTAHGLFTDAHSTPISRKSIKILNTEANVENAFGFDDNGESDIALSPIKSDLFADLPAAKITTKVFEKRTKIEKKKDVIVPSRFSIGEVKKHLRPVVFKGKAKADSVERIGKDENEEKREEKARNKKGEEAVTFSDTFDFSNAAGETNDKENVQEVPLFADLEPVHFKQPPRHSYKRKRIIAFNFTDDEEENEYRESHKRLENNAAKKRKISKVEKQRQKQIEKWAQSLNNTFDEIDNFDLVVEKQ